VCVCVAGFGGLTAGVAAEFGGLTAGITARFGGLAAGFRGGDSWGCRSWPGG
jgi:hypothetical protein